MLFGRFSKLSEKNMFGMNSNGDSNSHQFWVAAAACMAAAAARTTATNHSQGKLIPLLELGFVLFFRKGIQTKDGLSLM